MRTLKFKTSYETLISRCPGLFAYIELDEQANPRLHNALDSPLGCYGKIVENIKYDNITKENSNIVEVDDFIIANIDYQDNTVNDEKVLVKKDEIYTYKMLMRLYYEYNKYKVIDNISINNKEYQIIEYKNSRIASKGYKEFINFIEYHIGKVDVILENIDKKKCDLVPEFIYLVTVNDLYSKMLYLKTCKEFYIKYKNKIKDKIKDSDKLMDKLMEMKCKCIEYERMCGDAFLDKLKEYDEEAKSRANIIYENAQDMIKNKNNLFKINYSINLSTSIKDYGVLTPVEELKYKVDNNDVLHSVEGFESEDNDNDNSISKKIEFKTNSKLKSLRIFKNYLNKFNEQETPQDGTDWLYYYKIGKIYNLATINDEYGNIELDTTMKEGFESLNEIKEGEEVRNLIAYGDVIEEIKLDKENRTITFIYWTDAHLIARCKKIDIDDDENKRIKYDEFSLDKSYKGGIKYTETYSFDEESELNKINDDDFKDYIETDPKPNSFEKYEFITYNNTVQNYKQIDDKKVIFNSIISDSVETTIVRDIVKEPVGLKRFEYYNGISYSPNEDIDINIDRGVMSVLDKHIRFSEIKNLTELENFSNGGFYSLL